MPSIRARKKMKRKEEEIVNRSKHSWDKVGYNCPQSQKKKKKALGAYVVDHERQGNCNKMLSYDICLP